MDAAVVVVLVVVAVPLLHRYRRHETDSDDDNSNNRNYPSLPQQLVSPTSSSSDYRTRFSNDPAVTASASVPVGKGEVRR